MDAPSATPGDAAGFGRLARHGALYVAGMLLGRLMSLVMVPVYTHHLTPSAYGLLELLDTTDQVLVVVSSAAIADAVLRHWNDAPTPRARARVESTAVLSLWVAGAFVALLGAAFAPALSAFLLRDGQHALLLRLTFLSVTFQGVVEVPLSVLRGADRPAQVVAWTLGRSALGFALNIAFVVGLHLGVLGMVLSNLLASAVFAVSLSVLTLRRTGLGFDATLFRAMLVFGWPLVPGSLAMIALQHGRSYVLNALCPAAMVGLWGLGLRIGSLVSQVVGGPARDAWGSQMYALWNPDTGPARYARGVTLLFGLYLWAALCLSAVAREVIALVAHADYADAAWVVPGVALSCVLRELGELFRRGLVLGRNTRPIAWVEPLLALFDLGLSWLFVSRWGLLGAALAAPLTFAVYAGALHFALRRVLPVRFEYGRLVRLGAAAAGFALVALTQHSGHAGLDLGWKLSLVAVFPLVAGWWAFDRATLVGLWGTLRRRAAGW